MVTAVIVTVLLTLGCVAGAGWLAVRTARRRLRSLRYRLLRAPLKAGPTLAAAVLGTPAASPTWWSAQVDRRRLWRSAKAADHAVATAKAAGAPLGDLPSLNRQLQKAARVVDSALVAASRSRAPVSAGVQQRAREVRDSADRICTAACESLATAAHGHTSDLSRSVQVEVEALRAGLQTSMAVDAGR